MDSKSRDGLRKTLLRQRSQLGAGQLAAHAALLLQNLLQLPLFTEARRISAYLPIRGEMDAGPALNWARHQHKLTYLPVIHGDYLRFAPFTEQSIMTTGRFGIAEPRYDESDLLTPDALDLVLAPLVGFDKQLNRLGMGGGFYDRSFAFRAGNKDKPALIGIAHDFQKQARLDAEPWDIPMDVIVTEKAIYN
ncbi:MAG: 5-formyltetrahydrofolate cyclo-ligase [Gammaproteobacteria bacterium]|nr:5-formyltetrahydrofolate cyclo-ligase [Gammaproteobacteria bacterium]